MGTPRIPRAHLALEIATFTGVISRLDGSTALGRGAIHVANFGDAAEVGCDLRGHIAVDRPSLAKVKEYA